VSVGWRSFFFFFYRESWHYLNWDCFYKGGLSPLNGIIFIQRKLVSFEMTVSFLFLSFLFSFFVLFLFLWEFVEHLTSPVATDFRCLVYHKIKIILLKNQITALFCL
jgi:hypothetical protein